MIQGKGGPSYGLRYDIALLQTEERKAKCTSKQAAERQASGPGLLPGIQTMQDCALRRKTRLPDNNAAPAHHMITTSEWRRCNAVIAPGGVRPGQRMGRRYAGIRLESASLEVTATEA